MSELIERIIKNARNNWPQCVKCLKLRSKDKFSGPTSVVLNTSNPLFIRARHVGWCKECKTIVNLQVDKKEIIAMIMDKYIDEAFNERV